MKNYLYLIIASFFFAGGLYGQLNHTMGAGNTSVTLPSCGGTNKIYDTGGSAGNYTNASGLLSVRRDTLTIYPPNASTAVSISFNSMAIPLADIFDNIQVYEGSTPNLSTLLATGTSLINLSGQTFTSSHPNGSITLILEVNSALNGAGFDITATCVPKAINMPSAGTGSYTLNNCDSVRFYDTGGSSNNYPNSQNSTYTFHPTTTAQGINITFFDIDLDINDSIMIYDGADANAPLLAKYTGQLSNTIVLPVAHTASTDNATGAITVKMASDLLLTGRGFGSYVHCAPKVAPKYAMANDTLTICNAKIYDSGGPNADYSNMEDLVLTLYPATANQALKLDFDFFNLDVNLVDILLGLDRLRIYDGPDTNALEAILLTGNDAPVTVTSTHPTGALTLRFRSNAADTDAGFEISTSCVTPNYRIPVTGSSSITTCSGTLFDSGGEHLEYHNSSNATLTIFPVNPTDGVSLNFTTFQTDGISVETADDILYIYDGDSDTAPLIGRYFNNHNPGLITASIYNTSGALTLKFISNTIVTYSGWKAEISCTSSKNPAPHYVMNNDTINMCAGKIFDSGGAQGNYFNGENYTLVLCPSTPNSRIALDFVQFHTINANALDIDDALYIYNGIGLTAPLIDIYRSGTIGLNHNEPSGIIAASLTNTTGCLTLQFKSSLLLTSTGFEANVSCLPGCSPISTAMTINSHTPNSNGLYEVCLGETLDLSVTAPDANLTYTWTFGDGTTLTGTTVQHVYTEGGLYPISLGAKNAIGCMSDIVQERVIVPNTPTFTTSATPPSACVGTEVLLTGKAVANNTLVANCSGIVADTFELENAGAQNININCYAPGTVITSPTDLELCMKLDHAKMGDLDIELTCPSGKSIKILTPQLTNVKILGIPGNFLGGIGYNYCFNSSATRLLKDGLNSLGTSGGEVVAGTYKSEEGFEELVGCPVNGNWKLTIKDTDFNFLIGHSRGWNLDFSNGGFTPDGTVISQAQQSIVSTEWAAAPGLHVMTDSTANAVVQTLGANHYFFTATDNFGCVHKSDTVSITGTSGISVSITGPSTTCFGDSVTLQAVGGPTNAQFVWNTGETTRTIRQLPISGTSVIYTVTMTVPGQTCQGISNYTISVAPKPSIILSSTPEAILCMGSTAKLVGKITNASSINWSTTGSGSISLVSPDTITYTPSTLDQTNLLVRIYGVTVGHSPICPPDTADYTLIVHTPTTTPVIAPITGLHCPNTDIQIGLQTPLGGTNSRLYWYEDSAATIVIDSVAALTVAPLKTTTYYARAQNGCSQSSIVPYTLNVRDFSYADHGVSTNQYCTDRDGWHHFYLTSTNKIILSVQGDFSAQSAGFPIAKIHYKTDPLTSASASHQHPLTTPDCAALDSLHREFTLELSRSWEVSTLGPLIGSYGVRFYYDAADKDSLIALAQHITNLYADCDYQPLMLPNSDATGFYWYKSDIDTITYVVPTYGKFCIGVTENGAGLAGTQNINYTEFSGITKFSIGSGGLTLQAINPLPIKLLSFSGERADKVNNLYWTTASETENRYFNVQRSADGRNFITIGTVEGKGTTYEKTDYTFVDEQPLFGINYYRLEDVSFSGQTETSNIIALDYNGIVKNDAKFFPNPTNTSVTYEFTSTIADKVNIQVLNMLGQEVVRKQYSTTPGINQISIDLNEFPSGTFLINTQHENSEEKHTERIIKVK